MNSVTPLAWPILPLLFWAGVVITLLWLIWRGVRGPRRPFREPACGRCRYPVRGLSELTCPECGSDLRQVGITAPSVQFRGTWLMAALLAWTALLILIGGPLGALGAEALKRPTFTADHGFTPQSGLYRRAGITFSGAGRWNDSPPSERVRISIDQRRAGEFWIEWDRATDQLQSSEEALQGKLFDAAAVRSLLAAAGTDPQTPQVRAEADELHSMAKVGAASCRAGELLAPQTLAQAGVSTITSTNPPQWYTGAATGTLLVVWVAGCVLMIRARRRRMIRLGVSPDQVSARLRPRTEAAA